VRNQLGIIRDSVVRKSPPHRASSIPFLRDFDIQHELVLSLEDVLEHGQEPRVGEEGLVDRPSSWLPPGRGEVGPLLSHPRVHEQEACGHIEDPQLRVPRRGPYPAAGQQPIARLDAEPEPVLLLHPDERRMGRAAGIEIGDGLVLPLPTLGVSHDDMDGEGGDCLRPRALHRVQRRVARPALDECAGAVPRPAHYRWNEELDVPRLEVSDDVRGEERPVEVQALELDALTSDEADEFLDDFELPVRTPDERQRDGDPSAREDGVGGRVCVEPCGARLRLPPDGLVLLPLRFPVIRDERVVDGDPERAVREQAGRLLREKPVRPLAQGLHREVAKPVSDDAFRGGEFVLLADPARGCLPGRGEREDARHITVGVLSVEPLTQEPLDPEHGHLDDLLGGDPFPGAMVICPASTCSFGALRGSAIPSLAHVCTNTGTGGMAPNRF